MRLFAGDNFVPVSSIDFLVAFSTFSGGALLAFRPATSLQLNAPPFAKEGTIVRRSFGQDQARNEGHQLSGRIVEGSRRRVCVRKRLYDRCQINTSLNCIIRECCLRNVVSVAPPSPLDPLALRRPGLKGPGIRRRLERKGREKGREGRGRERRKTRRDSLCSPTPPSMADRYGNSALRKRGNACESTESG